GVVDQDVQPAELRGRALDDVAAVLALAQVAVERERAAAGVAHPAHGLARVVVPVVVGDGDVGALPRERDRDRAADAAVAAGDQGRAALELARAPIALLAVVRRRPQLGLPARPPLLLLLRPAARPLLRQRARALAQAVLALLHHDPTSLQCPGRDSIRCISPVHRPCPPEPRAPRPVLRNAEPGTEWEDRWRRSRSHAPAWPAPCSRWSLRWCARGSASGNSTGSNSAGSATPRWRSDWPAPPSRCRTSRGTPAACCTGPSRSRGATTSRAASSCAAARTRACPASTCSRRCGCRTAARCSSTAAGSPRRTPRPSTWTRCRRPPPAA